METNRFVLYRSRFGQGLMITVTFADGRKYTYDHDKIIEQESDRLLAMNSWEKYKNYTSSTNVPVWARFAIKGNEVTENITEDEPTPIVEDVVTIIEGIEFNGELGQELAESPDFTNLNNN